MTLLERLMVRGGLTEISLHRQGNEWIGTYRSAYPDARGTIENRMVSGNQAVGEILWTGTNSGSLNGMPPTNKSVQVRAVAIVTEEGGKIAARTWVRKAYDVVLQQEAHNERNEFVLLRLPPPR